MSKPSDNEKFSKCGYYMVRQYDKYWEEYYLTTDSRWEFQSTGKGEHPGFPWEDESCSCTETTKCDSCFTQMWYETYGG